MSNSIQIKRGAGRPNNKLLPFELGFDTSEGFLYIGGLLEGGSLGLAKELKVHWAQSAQNAQNAQNAQSAQSAKKLTTPRNIKVSLAEENSIDFDGSTDSILGVSGVLPVSKGGIGLSKLEEGKALIANGESSFSFREIKNNTALGSLGWTTTNPTQGISLVTLNTLAFWNGRYNNTASNLTYCNRGAFGTIVTKNVGDYISIDGGMLTAGKTITIPHTNDNSDNRRASFAYSGIQFHPYKTTSAAFGGFTYYDQNSTEKGKIGANTTKNDISYFYAEAGGKQLIKFTPGHGVVLTSFNYGTSDPNDPDTKISGVEGQIYLQVIN